MTCGMGLESLLDLDLASTDLVRGQALAAVELTASLGPQADTGSSGIRQPQ